MSTPDNPTKDDDPAVLSGRLTMARAFTQVLLKGYDALLNHKINFKSFPEWEDTRHLDEANKLPFKRRMEVYVGWMGRVESAITAAVRRAGMKLAPKGDQP